MSSFSFTSKFYLPTATGVLTLMAAGENIVNGTWKSLSINGGIVLSDSTINPWRIQSGDYSSVVFAAGYNTITGRFESSSANYSLTGIWESGWEA